MKLLDEFLPQILTYAPGCPVPVAFDHIRSAAQRLCERARIWRESDRITVSADESIIVVPDGAVLYEIERAYFNGMPLDPVSVSDLDRLCPGWQRGAADGRVGMPRWITQMEPNSIRVLPFPVDGGDLDVSLFVKPSEDCEELPDFFADQYRRVIADGALSEILVLPKQNFSDANLAGFFASRFERELDRLSTMNLRGQQRAPIRTVPNFM